MFGHGQFEIKTFPIYAPPYYTSFQQFTPLPNFTRAATPIVD